MTTGGSHPHPGRRRVAHVAPLNDIERAVLREVIDAGQVRRSALTAGSPSGRKRRHALKSLEAQGLVRPIVDVTQGEVIVATAEGQDAVD